MGSSMLFKRGLLSMTITGSLLAAGTVRAAQETGPGSQPSAVEYWLTMPDRSLAFQKLPSLPGPSNGTGERTIGIDTRQAFQEMDGFGCTLTGGSAQHLHGMSAPTRAAL